MKLSRARLYVTTMKVPLGALPAPGSSTDRGDIYAVPHRPRAARETSSPTPPSPPLPANAAGPRRASKHAMEAS